MSTTLKTSSSKTPRPSFSSQRPIEPSNIEKDTPRWRRLFGLGRNKKTRSAGSLQSNATGLLSSTLTSNSYSCSAATAQLNTYQSHDQLASLPHRPNAPAESILKIISNNANNRTDISSLYIAFEDKKSTDITSTSTEDRLFETIRHIIKASPDLKDVQEASIMKKVICQRTDSNERSDLVLLSHGIICIISGINQSTVSPDDMPLLLPSGWETIVRMALGITTTP